MQFSLLDRLTREDLPEGSRVTHTAAERLGKSYLRQDLAELLNTRRSEHEIDADFSEAHNSILTFGVVDFTSYNLNSTIDQERVRQSVERVIRQFEPRLSNVLVTLEQPEPLHPILHLRIEAMFRSETSTEPVTFEATLHRASRRITFSGARP